MDFGFWISGFGFKEPRFGSGRPGFTGLIGLRGTSVGKNLSIATAAAQKPGRLDRHSFQLHRFWPIPG